MEFGLLVLLALFCVGFAWATHGFLSPFNLFAMTRTAAVNVLVGLAMMTVIVTGGLDLSIGAIGVSAAMAAGWLMQQAGLSAPLGVAGGLAAGAALGLVNGVLIVRSRMHSFVVTLATMSIFFGAMIVLTRAQPFNGLPDGFTALGRIHWWRVVSPMLAVALAAGAALQLLYRATPLGREMLAAGANARAALLSGVDVARAIVMCHMLAGLLAAVAGLLLTIRNGAAIPAMAGNLGQDWLLPAFLGPVLGGALLSGGRVSVPGAVLGSLLVTVLNSGLLLLHVGEFWVQFFLGVLLLGAVTIDKARRQIILGLG
ncbi:MAG: ABC transporter permease [Rhodospirillales bacterium]|nr:ABC transporter permease [Rhodospirillales bacterium]